jgi:hypothetical protein
MARLIVPLETVSEALQSAEKDAANLVRGLSPKQGDWRPYAHSWSIRQCLDHLAKTNVTYARALEQAVSRSKGSGGRTSELAPGWFARWFIAQMEPPVRKKFKTFAIVAPAGTGSVRDALKAFETSHELLRRMLESAATVDFNRVRFRNPFVSLFRFSIATGLLIVNAHDRRHLWQARQIAEMAEFPRS